MSDLISKSRLKNELLKIPSEMGLIKKAWVIQAVNEQKIQDNDNNCNCQHDSNSRDSEPCCRCDSKVSENDDTKNKVTSLGIIVRMIDSKPYYELKYRQVGEKDYSIGYSSYDLKIVLGYIDEYFEIVKSDNHTNADRIRNMSDEELACLIEKIKMCGGLIETERSSYECKGCKDGYCDDNVRQWLQSEAE